MIGKTNWIGRAVLLFIVMASLAGASQSAAQSPGDWTWTDGRSTIGMTCYSSSYPCGQLGVYGTKGISASANLPGSRTDAMSWTDTTGHKWLFGGFGYGAVAGALGEQNDLWQSNAAGNAWEWVSGSNGPGYGGVYGTEGTAAAANVPGGRQDAVTWTDNIGNLWLFGGLGYDGSGTSNGYGYNNDLWMYNPTTNQWTWESGSSTVPAYTTNSQLGTITYGSSSGVYGTLGTAAAANTPGGRTNAMAWTDTSGNLWMFGGGYSNFDGIFTNFTVYNDFWEFNTNTKQWTWQGGSNTSNGSGVYGTLGTAASTNVPGARYQGGSWKDLSGNFWLFGGYGYDANGAAAGLDDLWQFNTSTKQWTWKSGANNINTCGNVLFGFFACEQAGNYGTQGTAAGTNLPGGRTLFVTWTDTSGNLWLFGGSGADSVNNEGWLNDLWKFNPSSPNSVTSTNGEWTWVGGSSTRPTCVASVAGGSCGAPGVYGTLGTAASANIPGARQAAVSWTDQSGNFWLFGGLGEDSASTTGYLNDMWEYQPAGGSSTPVAATPTFSVAGGTYSSAQSVTLSDSTAGALIYYTTDGTTPTTSSLLYNGTAIKVSSPTETLEAIAVASGFTNSAVATAAYTITPTGPAATLSPTELDFGSVFGSAPAQSTTLTNTGNATLTISNITLTGADPFGFQITSNTCGSSLAVGASCVISVAFVPASAASFTAAIAITDNATGSPQSVVLTGTVSVGCVNNPATPYVNCSPNDSTFTSDSISQHLTFSPPTVTNATTTAFSTEIVGKYNSTIVYDQTFTAAYGTTTVQGGITAANSAIAAAGGASIVIPAPTLSFSSTNKSSASNSIYSLDQSPSSTTSSTITTTTTFGPATITACSGAGGNPANPTACYVSQCTVASLPSAIMPTCMATNGGALTIAAGQVNLNLNTDNTYDIDTATTTTTTSTTVTAYAINAVSAATAPVALLSPTSLTFNPATAGTTTAAQSITLTNTGNATLAISGIAIGGTNPSDFAIASNACGNSLAVGASCTIAITFTPASATTFSAALLIADNATGSPQTVAITGTGATALTPQATLSPNPLTFPSTTVGVAATSLPITLSNPGTAALAISSIGLTGSSSFGQTNSCGASLAAGASCTITVSFTPSATGALAATISVVDNATGSPQTVAITGTGAAAGGATFTVGSPTPTASVQPGGIAQFNLLVASVGGSFTNVVTLSVTGLPPGAQASFLPPSVTPGSAGAASVLTVQTATGVARLAMPDRPGQIPLPLLSLLAGLPLGFVARTRRFRNVSGRWMLLMLAALALLPALGGCAGGYFGPAAKTYTVTVVGTSGALQQSTTISLTVQ
jgi:hypothetical protein